MNSDLGKRMKEYEQASQINLTKRMPCILRIDGKCFHSYTKKMQKPWDMFLTQAMLETARDLCENISGTKLAYWQSDEISLLLTDYENLKTQAWFEKNVQKMVSVSASIATAYFNNRIKRITSCIPDQDSPYSNLPLATFDSRIFVIPKEEVCNLLIWRQQDATRNSIQGLAQANFSPKQLHGLNTSKLQDKLMLEKNINWNDCLTWQKRGACIIKESYYVGEAQRTRWIIDEEIPIFSQDRNYIEKYI